MEGYNPRVASLALQVGPTNGNCMIINEPEGNGYDVSIFIHGSYEEIVEFGKRLIAQARKEQAEAEAKAL